MVAGSEIRGSHDDSFFLFTAMLDDNERPCHDQPHNPYLQWCPRSLGVADQPSHNRVNPEITLLRLHMGLSRDSGSTMIGPAFLGKLTDMH